MKYKVGDKLLLVSLKDFDPDMGNYIKAKISVLNEIPWVVTEVYNDSDRVLVKNEKLQMHYSLSVSALKPLVTEDEQFISNLYN